MADMMFPKTWEEFENHYGFFDSKQAYMFGNTRLIPSFRVEQWLDYIDDMKQLQKNKMGQIASMFGKKLNEEFTIKYNDNYYKAYFCKSGIRVRALYYDFWDSVFVGLITGEVKIIDD